MVSQSLHQSASQSVN